MTFRRIIEYYYGNMQVNMLNSSQFVNKKNIFKTK